MAKDYITKYRCWNYNYQMCTAILDTEQEAEEHCTRDYPEEIYYCELCGYETTDNTEAAEDCKYH